LRETFQFCWNALLSLEKGIQFLGTRSFFSKFFTVNSSPISSFFFWLLYLLYYLGAICSFYSESLLYFINIQQIYQINDLPHSLIELKTNYISLKRLPWSTLSCRRSFIRWCSHFELATSLLICSLWTFVFPLLHLCSSISSPTMKKDLCFTYAISLFFSFLEIINSHPTSLSEIYYSLIMSSLRYV